MRMMGSTFSVGLVVPAAAPAAVCLQPNAAEPVLSMGACGPVVLLMAALSVVDTLVGLSFNRARDSHLPFVWAFAGLCGFGPYFIRV